LSARLTTERFVTSEPVLVEVLNLMSKRGASGRASAIGVVRGLRENPLSTVVKHDEALHEAGLQLYAARPDKGYSLTDCMSMIICRDRAVTDILTHDRHFEQEGFTILM
jgi:predicted nucleic acid-binding protein